jgi:hypothetical protein
VKSSVGNITQDDFHVAEASSHATVGVSVSAGSNQLGLFGEQSTGSVSNDLGSATGHAVNTVDPLLAVGNNPLQSIKSDQRRENRPRASA